MIEVCVAESLTSSLRYVSQPRRAEIWGEWIRGVSNHKLDIFALIKPWALVPTIYNFIPLVDQGNQQTLGTLTIANDSTLEIYIDRAIKKLDDNQIIEGWNIKEHGQMAEYRSRLIKGGENITNQTSTLIKDAIQKILKEWSLGESQQEDPHIIGRGPDSAEVQIDNGVKVLVVKSSAHAEEFLRLS